MRKLTVLPLIFTLLLFLSVEIAQGSNSVGYWVNHDEERESVISDAISDDVDTLNIFNTESELSSSLLLKGKMTMKQKAEKHLAALLLSIANGNLDPLDKLTNDELALLQLISPKSGPGATIGEAVVKIENAIKTDIHLDVAKNLSEELSSRTIND
jgi:hypothetical protein